MFSPRARLVLVVACLGAAALGLAGGQVVFAVAFLAAGALFTWGHWRYGPVWLAFRAVRSGDIARARRLAETIKRPDLLNAQSKAYYHWLYGLIHDADGRPDEARACLEMALTGSLRTANDRALVQSQLAELALARGDTGAAREYLERAGRAGGKPGVEAFVARLKEELESSE